MSAQPRNPASPRRRVLAWLAPVGLALVLTPFGLLPTGLLVLAVVGLTGALLLAAVVRWPLRALVAVPVIFAVQIPVSATALSVGVPTPVVRAATLSWSLIGVGTGLAGLRAAVRGGHRLDRLDRVVLAYLGIIAAYLGVNVLLEPALGDVFALTPSDPWFGAVAARRHAGGLALFLTLRSLPWTAAARRRVEQAVVAAGLLLAAGAIIEVTASGWWQSFSRQLGVPTYLDNVLDADPTLVVRTEVAGRRLIRAGSWLYAHLQLGFVLLPALGLALAKVAERGTTRWWGAVGLLGAGIMVTLTRSAVLGGAVAAGTALYLTRHSGRQRRRLLGLAVVGLVAALALADPIGLAERTGEAVGGSDESTEAHLTALGRGVSDTLARPLGHGLGVGPELAQRTEASAPATENSYLEVSVEMGVAGGLALVAAVLLLIHRLGTARPRTQLRLSQTAAGAGLAAGALLLHVWEMPAATWPFFILVAAALPRGRGAAPATAETPGIPGAAADRRAVAARG